MTAYCVVIPAFNAEATLAEALASVLAQDPAPAKVIVVDDGSTDETAALVDSTEGVTLIRQANAGPGAATTRGIRAATQALIATLDADDIWLPGKMARQLAAIGKGSDIIFGHMQQFRDAPHGRILGEIRPAPARSTMLLRRDDFLRIGDMIDPKGGAGELIDWIARAREAGLTTQVLSDCLALRRVHENSMTYRLREEQKRAYLDIARAAIMRRRGPKP